MTAPRHDRRRVRPRPPDLLYSLFSQRNAAASGRETWSCGAVWSARHPVKVEAAGSNPVRTAVTKGPHPAGMRASSCATRVRLRAPAQPVPERRSRDPQSPSDTAVRPVRRRTRARGRPVRAPQAVRPRRAPRTAPQRRPRLDGVASAGTQSQGPCGARRWRMAASARHETRALLRAHLAAASGVPAPDPALPDLPPPAAAGAWSRPARRAGPGRGRRGREPLHGVTVDGPGRASHRRESGTRHSLAHGAAATRRWHVTGVTARVSETGELTPLLQPVNLICAIAPRSTPRGPAQPIRQPSPDSDKPAHRAAGPPHPAGAQKRSRWTRRSPARSTTHPYGAGVGLLGQDAASLGAMVRARGRAGGPAGCPVMRLFRPRCAAAECPRAVRGPQPRGNGGARRACGWT